MDLTSGCAHTSPRAGQSMNLRLKGKAGEVFFNRYRFKTVTQSHEEGGIENEKTQVSDFSVKTTIKDIKSKGQLLSDVETLDKDGATQMHDLAFPEVGEKIEFLLGSLGDVISVKGYPKESVFYVPSVSLSENQVKIGDTWEMRSSWVSESLGLPFQFLMVSVFKDIVPCKNMKAECALLEISGNVQMILPKKAKADFINDTRGEIMLAIDQGVIDSSLIYSQERFRGDGKTVKVSSCVIGNWSIQKSSRVVDCQPRGFDL